MRKIHTYLGRLLAVLTVSVLAVACSKSGDSVEQKVADYVSADADMAWTIDFERLFAATGTTVADDGTVRYSDYANSLMGAMPDYLKRRMDVFARNPFMKWNNAVGTTWTDGAEVSLVVWSVTDADDFARHLADNEGWTAGSESGYATATPDGSGAVVARDGLAFVVLKGTTAVDARTAVQTVEAARERAKSHPAADWQHRELEHGDMLAALMSMAKLKDTGLMAKAMDLMGDKDKFTDATMAVRLDVDGGKATLGTELLKNADGTALPLEWGAPIDPAMLRLLPAGTCEMAALGNFKTLLMTGGRLDESTRTMTDNFTGQVMLGFSLSKAALAEALSTPSPDNVAFTVLVQCKPGCAKAALRDVCSILGHVSESSDESATIEFVYGTKRNPAVDDYWADNYYIDAVARITCRVEGDVLAITNQPKADGPAPFAAELVKGHAMAFGVNEPKDSEIMKTLGTGFGLKVNAYAEGGKFRLEAEVTDTDKGFVEAIAAMIGK